MTSMKSKKIGVLMGGLSAEREVSLKSGAAVHQALLAQGYHAVAIDVGRDLAAVLEAGTDRGGLHRPAWPLRRGWLRPGAAGADADPLYRFRRTGQRPGHAQALQQADLRLGRNPHGPLPSFPPGRTGRLDDLAFGLPLVVKPVQEGSSVGVSIVNGRRPSWKRPWSWPSGMTDEILVEQYIKGQEVQVGILDDRPIGAIEIVPKNEFYDFEAKYTDGMAEHIFPARLEPALYEKAQQIGLAAHRALGCTGYSRVDLLVTEAGECYVLEVNTLPGMTALSLLPEIAAKGAGLSFRGPGGTDH